MVDWDCVCGPVEEHGCTEEYEQRGPATGDRCESNPDFDPYTDREEVPTQQNKKDKTIGSAADTCVWRPTAPPAIMRWIGGRIHAVVEKPFSLFD